MNTQTGARFPISTDPRIRRSEAAITGALLGLLAEGRDLASITVSEVADAAGVTRKTFYARFGSLDQVVERLVSNQFEDIAQGIDDGMLRLPLEDDALSLLVFNAYAKHHEVLTPLVRQCPVSLFLRPVSLVVEDLLERVVRLNELPPMPDAERHYFVATIAAVVHTALDVWVRRGFRETPEQIARFMDRLLSRGMQQVIGVDRW